MIHKISGHSLDLEASVSTKTGVFPHSRSKSPLPSSASIPQSGGAKTVSDTVTLAAVGGGHFQTVLNHLGLNQAQIHMDLNELHQQEQIPENAQPSYMAFEQAVLSLWQASEAPHGADTLHDMILDDPLAFGLPEDVSREEIGQFIFSQLQDSPKLSFTLVHRDQEQNEELNIFPPELGEKADQYWIWMVSDLPLASGPVWILQKRDQIEGAFHYGYW
jgi:hypothetical protein